MFESCLRASSQIGLHEAAVDGDEVAGGAACVRAGEEQDGLGAVFGVDGLMRECALGVEAAPARCGARRRSLDSSKGRLYFLSEAMTRSRGNIVEPLTTVAGLMPLTRSFGREADGEFAHEMAECGLRDVVSFGAALGDDGVGGAGEDDAGVDILGVEDVRGLRQRAGSWR